MAEARQTIEVSPALVQVLLDRMLVVILGTEPGSKARGDALRGLAQAGYDLQSILASGVRLATPSNSALVLRDGRLVYDV